MTEEYQRTRISLTVKNIDTLTVKDLIKWMLEDRMSQVVVPFNTGAQEAFVHVALVFDAVESAKLSDHVKRCTYESIKKANAKYEG
jgi:hypothetical protein